MRIPTPELLALLAFLALMSLPSAFAAEPITGRQKVRIVDASGHELGAYDSSYALVIGMADYSAGWRDLPGVRRDVPAVSAALQAHGFQVQVEMDVEGGTLDPMIRRFIAEKGQQQDARVLIYFAGHGYTHTQSFGDQLGYLVPSDAPLPEEDWQGFVLRAMPIHQIEVYARKIQSRHALFLFDSCFAGSIYRSPSAPWRISSKTVEPARQFITSGTADEVVPDVSVFRKRLVDALGGEGDVNQDGYVTGSELGHFLFKEVVKHSKRSQHPQYGRFRYGGLSRGDFVFQLEARDPPEVPAPLPPPLPPPPEAVLTESFAEMRFRYVPPGTFQMDDLSKVTVTRGFWMGETEVTQKQWRKLKQKKRNPSKSEQCSECPVEQVNWWEAVAYANRLSELAGLETCYELDCQGMLGRDFTCGSVIFRGLECRGYRLPSEVEWEWAARGDATMAAYAGDLSVHDDCDAPQLAEIAWYCGNSAGMPQPAGGKKPNTRGLHDMLGNVREWVQDIVEPGEDVPRFDLTGRRRLSRLRQSPEAGRRQGPASGDMLKDPLGTRGSARVVRGGGFADTVDDCRAGARRKLNPGERLDAVGFRLVRRAD